MTNEKEKTTGKAAPSIYRLLLPSFLAVIMCLLLFVGTSYAWFTTSKANANNQITAGKMIAKGSFSVGSSAPTELSFETAAGGGWKKTASFSVDSSESVTITVENAGSVEMGYMVYFTAVGGVETLLPIGADTKEILAAQQVGTVTFTGEGVYKVVCVNARALS